MFTLKRDTLLIVKRPQRRAGLLVLRPRLSEPPPWRDLLPLLAILSNKNPLPSFIPLEVILKAVLPMMLSTVLTGKVLKASDRRRSLESKSPTYIPFQLILMTTYYRDLCYEDWMKKQFDEYWNALPEDEKKLRSKVFRSSLVCD